MMSTGLIQVYSGNGKGKTTAAIGQSIRAKASGLRVLFIFFFKDSPKEAALMEKAGIDVKFFAPHDPLFFPDSTEAKMREETIEGMEYAARILIDRTYDIVILDEILIALKSQYISEEELLGLIEKKSGQTELIITGRGITDKIRNIADLVSDIKKIKHPYDHGIQARQGIEI